MKKIKWPYQICSLLACPFRYLVTSRRLAVVIFHLNITRCLQSYRCGPTSEKCPEGNRIVPSEWNVSITCTRLYVALRSFDFSRRVLVFLLAEWVTAGWVTAVRGWKRQLTTLTGEVSSSFLPSPVLAACVVVFLFLFVFHNTASGDSKYPNKRGADSGVGFITKQILHGMFSLSSSQFCNWNHFPTFYCPE